MLKPVGPILELKKGFGVILFIMLFLISFLSKIKQFTSLACGLISPENKNIPFQ